MKKTFTALYCAVFSAAFCMSSPLLADDNTSIEKLQAAANQGDAEAQLKLGSAYETGDGVNQDDVQAMKWIKKSADQGNTEAQFHLGIAYRSGFGVPMDKTLAYMWFELAAKQGSNKAIETRKDLANSMTDDEIEKARDMANDWKPLADSN